MQTNLQGGFVAGALLAGFLLATAMGVSTPEANTGKTPSKSRKDEEPQPAHGMKKERDADAQSGQDQPSDDKGSRYGFIIAWWQSQKHM